MTTKKKKNLNDLRISDQTVEMTTSKRIKTSDSKKKKKKKTDQDLSDSLIHTSNQRSLIHI